MDITSAALLALPAALHAPVSLWWERACLHADLAAGIAALPDPLREELVRVVAASEFAASVLFQDAGALAWFVCNDDPGAGLSASALYEAAAATAPGTAEAKRLLREWRRRAMLRIAWRDIVGRASVTDTLRAVSDLADASIRASAAAAQVLLDASYGKPRDAAGQEVPFIVLGLGKLGGRELNFSSDVDLVFLYGQAGETDGARSVDNSEYFNLLGREVIELLDSRTGEGLVFRVDMRLRPFGDSGPLVVSLGSLEDYLQNHGRDWERYAWVKARAVVGRAAFETATRDFIRPFVYRRYLDFGVFDSLRGMKALIAREVARHELDQHLKLGTGGIRELEFIVQSMQLVRGGTDRRLQNASLLDVLPLLAGSRLLAPGDVAELQEAYAVLRKAENAVQMIRDQQTHMIPEEPGDRARMAVNFGLSDWDAVITRIDAARRDVARQFDALVFGTPQVLRKTHEGSLEWLASEEIRIDEELTTGGFPPAHVPRVAALLETFRRSAGYRRLDDTGQRRLHVILFRVLQAASARPDPGTVFERVLRIVEAIGARSSYLALLKEQPAALERLIDVCAISGFLARQIADFPLLLDELIDPTVFDELPSRAAFVRELAAHTERVAADDPERQVEALRQFQKAEVFGVAFADLSGRMPLMMVSDRLTDIAELIIARCVELAWDQMTAAYGVPVCGEEAAGARVARVAVAGYGKLGGWELGYGSDLDLVFLHDSIGEFQQTLGDRPLDNSVFFLRLGQRIVHLLTMHSAWGRLYEVDMRLRPNGKGGFLMTGIEAFERYQHQDAWTWEHQALLRARAVAGDPLLCARFETARRGALGAAVHRDTLRSDVVDMRARMRRELSHAGAGQFDIKQDAGGIADIEFLVQYWVLSAAAEHPQLLIHTDNIRQLDGLASVGVVDVATASWLTVAYIGYRSILHRLSLEGGERVVDAAAHEDTRARIRAIWRDVFESIALSAPWAGPFGGVPPLDRVSAADFQPALEAAMAEKLREIEDIARTPGAPTFVNTLEALERAGRRFNRVISVYEIWASNMNTGGFPAVERTMSPKIAAFRDRITQNVRLFARIAAVHDSAETAGLDPVQRRLCWHYHTSFVRAGAQLNTAAKKRVAEINERLAGLYAIFSQNVLADETDHVLFLGERRDLDGLPDAQCEAAASAATALGRPGQWAILNTRSSMDPFLTYARRRDLRERVWRTYYGRGDNGDEHDNKTTLTDILSLRSERAKLLGYPTHAHWRLADSMAQTPENALALLMRVWPAALRRVAEEVADMQRIADVSDPGIRIETWDYRYYAEKVRQEKFDLDMNEVKPYLQLEKLREALFWSAGRLYGFEFAPVPGLPVHHPDVRVWEVTSRAGVHVGLWYFDPYARPGKSSGAWMSEYRDQETFDGRITPIVSNNTNFVKSEGSQPILISWDDAVTLFHEFGHALHTLNSEVAFPTLSGTHTVRDFVEFPSQLNENWLMAPELLTRFAVHYQTGAPIPDSLVTKLKAARTFNQGFATTEYLAAALVDMRLHLSNERITDPARFEAETLTALGMPKEVAMRHRTPQFAHIFASDSYSAGYYSYLWAEVLDHDAYAAFTAAGDPFDKGVAKRLHDDIMSVGNSIDPGVAYRRFRGRDPEIDALLRARGFAVTPSQGLSGD